VLFFVYPLKFLFTMLTVMLFDLQLTNPPTLDGPGQVKWLYVIYGAGFAGAWGLYALLYAHAWRQRVALALDEVERLYTRATIFENLIYVFVCVLSLALALLTDSNSLPGLVYFLLGPLQWLNGWWFSRKARALAKS